MARKLHCWKDYGEYAAKTCGFMSAEHIAALAADAGCTCMLPRDHEGDHEWTPDSAVGVTFGESDDEKET